MRSPGPTISFTRAAAPTSAVLTVVVAIAIGVSSDAW